MRSYTADVTLIAPDGPIDVSAEDRKRLDDGGVTMIHGPITALEPGKDVIVVDTAERLQFDTVYPALGSDTHVQLAEMLGAEAKQDCCIVTDAHQRTSYPGPLCGGRRGQRPRPDQPRHGRRRGCRDHHPQ